MDYVCDMLIIICLIAITLTATNLLVLLIEKD